MHRSACRPTGSTSVSVRPLSSSTRWNACGPSPAVTPVHIDVYGFIRSAVEERGRSWRNTSRSCQRGTSFSIPITVISVSGSVRHIRPLPSDSTTITVPVSATAKFAPEIATFARRNFSRRWSRAASASARGSSVRSAGAGRPARAISRSKISRISRRLRWIAGTRMCDGRSPPSCTMSSARSVSQAAIPSFARASLSSISWVTIDLTLITSSAPASRTRRATMALASAASRAQWTVPPAAVTFASSRSRSAGRSRMTSSLIAAPARRSASQSARSSTARARLVRIVFVAAARFVRSCASARAVRAACGNGGVPAKVGVGGGLPRPGAGAVTPRPPRRGSRPGA